MVASANKEVLDVQVYTGIAELPHFNPDLDKERVPLAVKTFRDLIEKAEGVIICTPEYVFSLPGVLKNAIEWTVSTTVFSDKPVAVVVASGLGEKAYESLLLIMKTLGANVAAHSSLLIQGARSKLDSRGQLVDHAIGLQIQRVVDSLIDTMK
jgi:NAD(P)H-dependent FMN reductase